MPENIGGISATITLDISDFEAALNKAVQMAGTSSQQIGQALSSGASAQIDQLSKSIDSLGTQFSTLATQMRSSADAMSSGLKQVGSSAGEASGGIDNLLSAFAGAGGIPLTIGAIAGGMIELGHASIDAFANLQRATLALTSLTGSGVTAEHELSGLKALAQDEALSFPELIQANQRLTALGVSAEQIPGFLRAAADGAAAMNTNLIVATNAVDRMVASGSVAGRNLTQLGLTTNDLGKIMGVAASKVGEAFRALDESARVDVMVQALQKFDGAAARVADSVQGSFTRLDNTATFALQHIGEAMAPAVKGFTDLAGTAIPALSEMVAILARADSSIVAFAESLGGFKDAAIGAVAALVPFGDQMRNSETASAMLSDSFRDSVVPGLDLITRGFNEAALAVQTMTQRGSDATMEKMIANIDRLNHSAQALGGADFKNAWDAALFSIGKVASATQQVISEQEKANQKVDAARIAYDQLSTQLSKLTVGTGEYNEKQLETNRALSELDKATRAADVSTKQLTDSFGSDMQAAQKLIDNLSRAQQAFDVLTNTQNRTEQQEVALGIAARNLETAQKQLQAATDGLTQAQENHLTKLKVYGPAFDGISKIVSEISGGMRLYQQATKDAETGDTAYVTVVKSLTDAEQKAWTQLQALYTLRAQYIEQGTNTKAIDQDVAKAEKNLEEAMKNADLAAQGQLSTMGKGQGAFKSFADGVNQATAAIGNSNAILAENNKKIEASIQAAAGAIPAYKGMTSAFDNTTESLMRQSAAFKDLYANASGLSAVEAELARTELGLPERIDAATNSFKEMTQQITGSASALELWATAVSYARSAMATTTPQEGITNGNDLTHQLALAQQLEAVQKIYSDAYIDAFGNLVVPEFNAPGGNSKNKITHGPMASISSGITQGTQPSGGGAGISGGNLRIDPNTGIPTSSNQVSALSSVTQALTDAQTAYNSALSAMQKTGVVIPSQLQSLSDALQKATADYLGFGHVTESATSGLDNLSTAIGNVSVAAASSTAVLGTALSNTETTITQVTQATGALLKQINDIGSVPSATSVTPSSASPLAYGASGAPKVGTNWQNGINVTINNPVVTSQSQADAVGQQIVTQLRNLVGLKL